ncbi:hypothetical protein D3C77_573040 [compost metagenome]
MIEVGRGHRYARADGWGVDENVVLDRLLVGVAQKRGYVWICLRVGVHQEHFDRLDLLLVHRCLDEGGHLLARLGRVVGYQDTLAGSNEVDRHLPGALVVGVVDTNMVVGA